MNSIEALSVFPQLAKFLPLDEYDHACTVAGMCKDDERTCMVALFHDVVEDGYATFEELQNRFHLDPEQMAALDAITRRDGERYFDYINRVKQNKMAKAVKLADLQHNITRCAYDLPNRWGLIRRYAKAYGMLIDEWKELGK
jgi:(p)ppGpp synthase/HD superfamily hydrolase